MSSVWSLFGSSSCETETAAATRHTQVMNQLSTLTQAINAMVESLSIQAQALRKIMTDVENLTAAVTALQTASAAAASAIETELAKIAAANTGNDPAIAAAVTAISGVTAALTAEAAKVTS